MAPNSPVGGDVDGRPINPVQADASGAVTIGIYVYPSQYEGGDLVPYTLTSNGQTVASDTVELVDLCTGTGTFAVTRSCETPDSMSVAVAVENLPANESIRLFLYTDAGKGFYFTQPGSKGTPGFNGSFISDADGSFSGTVVVNAPDNGVIAANTGEFSANVELDALERNYAALLEGTVTVPACQGATTPQPPVTNPQPPVTNPQPPVTNPQPPVTNPQPPATNLQRPGPSGQPQSTVNAGAAARSSVPTGGQQTLTVPGFAPGESVQVTLHSTPVDLGVHSADGAGVLHLTFTVPAGLEPGDHRVELVGQTSHAVVNVPFQVVTAAPLKSTTAAAPATLAYTGADVQPLIWVGVLALFLGAVLSVAGSRRAFRR